MYDATLRARARRSPAAVIVCTVAVMLGACAARQPTTKAPAADKSAASTSSADRSAARRDGATKTASDVASPGAAATKLPTAFRRRRQFRGPPPPTSGGVAGAHILITFTGAMRARARTPRDQAAARQLASKIARELCPRPTFERFAAAARKYSDGPTRARGGWLGKWPVGRMVPPFDAAVAKLHFNECRGPVLTRFGFHIVLRFDPAHMPKRP